MDYTDATYGERVVDVYDQWYGTYDEAAIEMLAELAGTGGRALELGIGTGRIAIPLAARGIEVQGIDASQAMVARLRGKPGGEAIKIEMGSFADARAGEEFSLIYIVFNTFFALQSQEEQVRAFRNVSEQLAAAGSFLIEAFVPDMARYSHGQATNVVNVATDRVELDVAEHDPVSQRVMSQRVILTDGNVRLYPVQIRYAWPSELDLMARLAGLRLRDRWGGWRREPFNSQSTKHVSVYERPG